MRKPVRKAISVRLGLDEDALVLVRLLFDGRDEALFAEQLREAALHLRGGHLHLGLARDDRVAHAGEEICNRIGHVRTLLTSCS